MRKNGFRLFSIIAALLFAVTVMPISAAFSADKYPNKPIKLVIPWKPGGGTDRTMRIFAPYLEKTLGVPVSIINKG